MASVWGELKRRNVVKVAVAYAVVGWLLVEVSSVLLPAFDAPDWVLRVVILLIGIGFVLTVVISWFYDLTSQGLERTGSSTSPRGSSNVSGRKLDFAIIGALVLALGFVVYEYVLEDGEDMAGVLPNSVAVLPLANLSPDPENAYFAAGIHDTILNELAKLQDMNVIARTSVLQYADGQTPISEIAEALNVETVLEGSVQYADDRILVTAQLIDPETSAHLWSDNYDRGFADIFAVQADIAMNIANALEAEFSAEEQETIEKIPTASSEAYRYYLAALAADDRDLFYPLLDQAISIDPDFALAYARKAYRLSQTLTGAQFDGGPGEAAALERSIRFNAQEALRLDPTLGIAQAALAVPLYVMTWRGTEAEQAYQNAFQLSPNDVNVLVSYGRFKRHRGEFDEATRLLRRAAELDPNNQRTLGQLAVNYWQAGDWEAAAVHWGNHVSRGGGIASNAGLATVEAVLGNHAEAVRLLQIAERLQPPPFRLGQMAHTYALLGRPDEARRLFTALEQREREAPVRDADWVRAYIAVGDYSGALQRLRTAVDGRAPTDLATLTVLVANPWADPELEKPEFRAVLDRLWLD